MFDHVKFGVRNFAVSRAFYLNREKKSLTESILFRLASSEREVRLDFQLSSSERSRGYEDTWQEAGARRVAYYTGVPSGGYRFHVKAANADGLWNETAATRALQFLLQNVSSSSAIRVADEIGRHPRGDRPGRRQSPLHQSGNLRPANRGGKPGCGSVRDERRFLPTVRDHPFRRSSDVPHQAGSSELIPNFYPTSDQ